MGIYVSSVSNFEATGTAQIIIDGSIPVPENCDDPLVELFRSVKINYFDETVLNPKKEDDGILFVIIPHHRVDRIVLDLLPSNRRGRTQEELVAVANTALQGGNGKSGILKEYTELLKKYIYDVDGLELYLSAVKGIEEAPDEKKMDYCNLCNLTIKKFVAKLERKIPSRKTKVATAATAKKEKKTKAEKRASSEEYLKNHPEILANKKPAD